MAGKMRDKHLLTLPLPTSLPLGTPAQGTQISGDLHNHYIQEAVMGDEDTP